MPTDPFYTRWFELEVGHTFMKNSSRFHHRGFILEVYKKRS